MYLYAYVRKVSQHGGSMRLRILIGNSSHDVVNPYFTDLHRADDLAYAVPDHTQKRFDILRRLISILAEKQSEMHQVVARLANATSSPDSDPVTLKDLERQFIAIELTVGNLFFHMQLVWKQLEDRCEELVVRRQIGIPVETEEVMHRGIAQEALHDTC